MIPCSSNFLKINLATITKLQYNNTDMSTIGDIGNYYGGLSVKTKDGKFFWGIEDHNGTDWQEIPESLYLALMKYETERQTP